MSNIVHIFSDNQMVGWLTKEDVIDDLHVKSLENTLETYDIQVHGHNKYVEYLSDRNRITIPDEDGNLIEFIIATTKKVKGRTHTVRVLAKASYKELRKTKVIRPTTLNEYTVSMLTGWALDESDWRVGIIESDNYRTMTIENPTNPYEFLKRIANEFDLELRFRVEHDGNRITGRFVDLLERVGSWNGREVEFGHDLNSIERNEKTDKIVTCLVGYAPEDEDGNRLEVIVKDEEAIQRWGELWDYYEPTSSRLDMTESELRQYTRTELNKRISKVVTYKADIIDLENVPGMQNKKIRFGDTIHIKDLKFNPALYLEARVFEQRRSLFKRARKQVKLGDFTEFTEEEVDDIWNQLRQQINQKIGMRELLERTYDKLTIDQKDTDVYEDGKTFAEAVGVDAKGYADTQDTALKTSVEGYADSVASTAETNAKSHAETVAGQAEANAKAYAVAQTVYDNKMAEIAGDLADKADITYVDGELQDKQAVIPQQTTAPTNPVSGDFWLDTSGSLEVLKRFDGTVWKKATPTEASEVGSYTISEVDNMINNVVSVTEYETDMDGIVTDLTDHNTRIGQNEEAIGLKADQTELDTVAGTVSEHSAELEVMADEINSKVDSSYVEGAIAGIEVGGRNLIEGTEGILLKDTSTLIVPFNEQKIANDIGKNITVSFKVRLQEGQSSGFADAYFRHDTNAVSGFRFSPFEIEEDWKTLTKTFKVNEELINTVKSFAFRANGYAGTTDNLKFEVSELKIEKGNKATDWIPAPEDTQSQIDDLDFTIEEHSTQISQNATNIQSKADSTVVDGLETRITSAETDIDGLNSTISLKADSTVVDGIEGRVTTAELNIDGLEGQITQKVEENDVRSIFTQEASSFTFEADQINFDGHVFGEDATFAGTIEGAIIEGSRFVSGNLEIGGGLIEFQDSINNLLIATDEGFNHRYFDSRVSMTGALGLVWNDMPAEYVESEGWINGGYYIRYHSGVQICWFNSPSPTTGGSTPGGDAGLYWAWVTLDFPLPFIEPPNVTPIIERVSGVSWGALRQKPSTDSVQVYLVSASSGAEGYLGYKAIGRWK